MVWILLVYLPLSLSQDLEESQSVVHSLPRLAPYAPYSPHPGPYSPTPYPPYHSLPDSPVYRSPYEVQGNKEVEDAVRTKDSDIALHGFELHHPVPHHPSPHHPVPPHPVLGPVAPHGLAHPAVPHNSPHHPLVHAVGPPDPVLTHHHLKPYHPYQYDINVIPECAITNKHFYNLTFCLQDDYYPVDTIKHELERNKPLIDRILSDITYQSADNLVDGLTKVEEEGYTYSHYYGSQQHQTYADNYSGYKYSPEYYKDGGYLCPSDIFYGRPKRAANTYGAWKVIVNLPDEYYAAGYGAGYEKYTQTQRLEQCMYPGAPCSFIDHHYHSACIQKHNFVRLLAYTYTEGLHIDSFKLPVACSCHLRQPHHYGYGHTPPPYTHHHPTPYGKKK